MVITTKLGIDLQRPLYPSVINAVQGDQNTRQLEISLYSGGMAFELPKGTTAAMRYCKPDKTKGYYDTMPDESSAYSVYGNTVSILIAPQMLTVPGAVDAQVVLMNGSKVLSTFTLQLCVEADPSAGALSSEDYINWIQWIEAELDAYLEQLKVNGEFVGGTVVGAINMTGNVIYGLPDPADNDHAANMGFVNQQVKTAAPRNLLDNSDFTNPVNQRGQASYHNTGYTIDRWLSYNNGLTVNVHYGYIELVNTTTSTVNFLQKLEKKIPVGKNITTALKVHEGSILTKNGTVAASGSSAPVYGDNYSAYYNGASGWMTIGIYAGASIKLEWLAIYEGEYTAENLPEYQHKGYGAELAECMRYYQYFPYICVAMSQWGFYQNYIQWVTPMRVTPTIKLYSYTNKVEGSYKDANDVVDISGAQANNSSKDGFCAQCTGGMAQGHVYQFYVEALADL